MTSYPDIITTDEQLTALSETLKSSAWIALDTEFLREQTYYPELCLLQLATPELVTSVDPFAVTNLDPLKDILLDESILKIMHAGRQDMELFYHLWQRIPSPIFDTQIAATLTGRGDQIGYGNLVKAVLDIELPKAHSRADWKHRPLSDEEIDYALDDVRHLGKLYTSLYGQLESLGRTEWVEPEMKLLGDPTTYIPNPEALWKKMARRKKLSVKQSSVLSALVAWREKRAQKTNRPRKWILRDEILLDLAIRLPDTDAKLARIRGIEPGLHKKIGKILLDIIQDALEDTSFNEAVTPVKRLTENQEAMLDLLMAAVRVLAAKENLAPAAVCTRRELEGLVRGQNADALFSGWRSTLIAPTLRDVMLGEKVLVSRVGSVTIEAISPACHISHGLD